MERGIEYSYHRCVRHEFLTSLDAGYIRRVVGRSDVEAFFQDLDHVIVDQGGVCQLFAGMYDSVAYSADFVHALDNAGILVLLVVQIPLAGFVQRFKYVFDRFFVCCHRSYQLEALAVFSFMLDHGTVDADSFNKTLRQ